MKALNEKYLLKRAAIDIVPPSIVRRPKQPYRAPGATSFFDADGNSPEYVRELLSPSRLRDSGIFDVPAVGQLLAKGRAGRIASVKDHMAFVGILSTQLFADRFVSTRNHGSHTHRDLPIHRRKLLVRSA
jgi:asparagine synthase (glutamine-hydrolysing)